MLHFNTARCGRVPVEVDTAAVSTSLAVLDARLQQPDLLAMSTCPQAFFGADTLRLAVQVVAIRQVPSGRQAPVGLEGMQAGPAVGPATGWSPGRTALHSVGLPARCIRSAARPGPALHTVRPFLPPLPPRPP